MEIVYRNLSAIKPNPKNPRKGTKEAVEKLAESIKGNPKFFEARPILLSDRTGELVIIGGERRSEAARLLGMETVPTILLSGLSESQEDEILIKDNTNAGVWDDKKLSNWGGELLKNWGIENIVTPEEFGTDFKMPDSGRSFFRSMTFTFSEPQARIVEETLKQVQKEEKFKECENFGNTNQNGNALYYIVSRYGTL